MPDYTALVTGASSGVGRATAEAFLQEEWSVVATARDPDDLAALADAGCDTRALDVTAPGACKAAVEDTVAEHGRIDCLVNAAGYAQYGPLEDVPTRRLHRQFDVNCYGPHRLAREALPHMREAGRGTVVNVSSALGRLSVAGVGPYAASKHALEAMSDALRMELDGLGVDVVLVEPGPVDTDFRGRAQSELEALERTDDYASVYGGLEDRMTLGDLGAVSAEAVADTIVHAATCADPAARYPVGQVARAAALARFLPDSVRDGAVAFLRRVVS